MDPTRTPATPADEGRHAAELLDLGDAFFELDRAWRIVRVNRNQERLSGRSREETLGRVFWEVWPETADPDGPYWREYHRCMEARVPVQFEAYFQPLDLWTGVTAYPVSTGGVAVFFRDVGAVKRAEMQATARAAEVEAVLSSVADGVLVYDREGRILRANDVARDILAGYTPGEWSMPVGERLASARPRWFSEDGEPIDVDDLPGVRAIRRGETHGETVLRLRRDGGDQWLRVSAAPLRLGGTQAGAVVTLADITDRKRAEAALRRAQEQLRAAHERLRAEVESTPLAVVEWDAEYRVAGYSRRAEELFGWSRDEVVGKRIDEIPWVPEEDWPSVRAVMRDMSTGARSSNVNANRNVRKDGEIIACEWYNSTLHDEGGRLVSVLSLVLDVTARERALASLRESEARLRLALDAAHLVAWEFDPVTTRVTLTENAAEVLANRAGQPHRDSEHGYSIIHPDDVAQHRALVDAAVERGGSYVSVYRQVAEDGGVLWVEERGRALTDASGRTVRLVGVTQNVTERKKAEEALRAANEKLREADRRKDEFLGMLSHELRNPLAPIRNALFLLERAAPTGEQARRAREVASRQVAHLTRLVDDLLDVTRIARGRIELRRGDVDVAALARRTAEDHRATLHERRLALDVQLPAEPVVVDADDTRLAQVLGNLLHNAAKFTPAGGRVTVAVAAEGNRAVIRVRDTGPGIAPEVLPTIFEPFTQAKQTLARSEGGLGLGLALVKGLVAKHGGDVRAHSPGEGRGAEFVVTLPLAEATRAASRDRSSVVPEERRRRRVLVVDDNRDAADTIAALVQMSGHDVEVAYDGRDALAKSTAALPDVVFCDIGLPGMDGYELARRLRALAADQRVRLVALSGYAQPEDVAKALEAGFDAHVAKPPDPDRLVALVG